LNKIVVKEAFFRWQEQGFINSEPDVLLPDNETFGILRIDILNEKSFGQT
tara:strand:+ start:59 stop:208 length:150 start_codon:yes stop_codon:yes gene_type:complete